METTTKQAAQIRISKPAHRNMAGRWEAETIVTIEGRDYSITTMKTARGVVSVSIPGKFKPADGAGFYSFQFMWDADRVLLHNSEAKTATQKTIAEAHAKGLAEFCRLFNCEISGTI